MNGVKYFVKFKNGDAKEFNDRVRATCYAHEHQKKVEAIYIHIPGDLHLYRYDWKTGRVD